MTWRAGWAMVAAMFSIVTALVGTLLSAFKSRAGLVAENLALRQQLATLKRTVPRPRLCPVDRAFWILLSRVWSRWTDVLAIVQPATVIGWHRRGFARFWAWKSRRPGRPPVAPENRATDRADGSRQSALEPTPHRERTRVARARRQQEHGREVHAEASGPSAPTTVGHMEDIPPQPPRGDNRARLPHGAVK